LEQPCSKPLDTQRLSSWVYSHLPDWGDFLLKNCEFSHLVLKSSKNCLPTCRFFHENCWL
jgi:hypothetical protein